MLEDNQKPLILLAFANSQAAYLDKIPEEASLLEKQFQSTQQSGFEFKSLSYTTTHELIKFITKEQNRLVLFHFAGHSNADFLRLDQGELHAKGFSQLLQQCPHLKLDSDFGSNGGAIIF